MMSEAEDVGAAVNEKDAPWDGKIERLTELYAVGKSYTAIAAALNSEFASAFTRSAVGGKISRLGLSATAARPKPKPKLEAEPKKFGAGKLVNHGNYFKIAEGYPGVEEVKAKPEDFVYRCDIMALDNQTCRFPVGEPQNKGFFFCGAPDADLAANRPYCAYHARTTMRGHFPIH